ncbi:MAG: tRNA lysidine(34) synthetase TilS [Sulfurovum sp.]|nr:tRNA lysidine(34) synthetase TilS [Sulfurovum sp.]MDD3601854.1 tRNA lysidine(34) synthetase TilS [Sulfurovum sp.]
MPNKSFLISHFSFLIDKKNLLAFSAGIDSSALFFLLLENNVPFDIAIVNYGTRENSDKEEAHAKALADKYKLVCHSIKAPSFTGHFEANARKFRYAFFDRIIEQHRYDTLLMAHQLNDQLEWLLMRLTKGAGVCELVGLEPVSQRKNYTIVRPLLSHTKEELLDYLHTHGHPYFVDESNRDERYERNYFRQRFADPLIARYHKGIRRSFDYLRHDKRKIQEAFEVLFSDKELRVIRLHTPSAKVKAADLTLKKLGYLLSASQREEIRQKNSLVIGGKWAVAIQEEKLYIAPYRTTDMPKPFKEQCRILKIPAKIRAYLFEANISPSSILPHS